MDGPKELPAICKRELALVGLGLIVFLLLSIAKVAEAVDLTWWAVTAPVWGPLALLGFLKLQHEVDEDP